MTFEFYLGCICFGACLIAITVDKIITAIVIKRWLLMKIELTPDELLELLKGTNQTIVERIRLITEGIIESKTDKEDWIWNVNVQYK